MAQDRPTAPELLDAIEGFLRDEALPALERIDARLAFQTKVAINSLMILKREAALGPRADSAERARVAALLGRDGDLLDLNRELSRQLRTGERDERDAALMDHLRATIADKIAIANPKWR
ncbi:MAG: hypothetical protein IPK81_18480 [Rhodospirillales bacterium]|nr:MAG: hypothetical protein IPK81_18480 [Rhodospirillales bacterium]